MSERLWAKYWMETSWPLEQAAEMLAGEQSSGTFVRVPGETDELRERHAARVERLVELEAVRAPSLPGAAARGDLWRRAEVEVSWPLENFGLSLPNLLTTVAGNLWELSPFSGLRLLDVRIPEVFLAKYAGPQFGVAGTRALTGVHGRPLVGTIIKPSVGLSPEETAGLVASLAAGGIDFIKDDELQSDGPHCRFEQRVDAVMAVLERHADRTGQRVMYAFNLTGDLDEMKQRHDYVRRAGGTCVMVSMNSVGLTGVVELRRHAGVAIHGHRNGWGLLGRSPAIGMSFVAYQKFWRLAGVDHLHVNGLRNKFCENDASVIASARECLTPMFAEPAKGCEVLPVFSSGQWAGQVEATWLALRSVELLHACGGGIMAHPGGIAAGVRSIRLAWAAAAAGVPWEEEMRRHEELRQAAEKFGGA